MESIHDSIQSFDGLTQVEIIATIFNITYVILAARANIACWFFGIIGALLTFYVSTQVYLYSDCTLQLFYVITGFLGWISWHKKKEIASASSIDGSIQEALSEQIEKWTLITHVKLILLGIVLTFFVGKFWSYFGGSLPYIDAFTTSFSIITTYLVIRKEFHNWVYWFIIDFVSIFVFFDRGLYFFSFLFLFYAILSIYGYISWGKKYRVQEASA